MNPDHLIVRINMDRYRSGKALDTGYLAVLGADAVPALLEEYDTMPMPERGRVAARMLRLRSQVTEQSPLVWNRARAITSGGIASRLDAMQRDVAAVCGPSLPSPSSYLYFAPTSVVRPGGYFIIPARCEEGAGVGVGEQRFFKAMRDAPDIQSILDDARRNGYPPRQQRAFVMAKVLEQSKVVIVGSECPDLVAECKMIPAATMEEALKLAAADLGSSCSVLIVPHAMLTLPVIQEAS